MMPHKFAFMVAMAAAITIGVTAQSSRHHMVNERQSARHHTANENMAAPTSQVWQPALPVEVAKVGEPSPQFRLTDLSGKNDYDPYRSRSTKKIIFFCGCDRCRAAAKAIAIFQRKGELCDLISVVGMDKAAVAAFKRDTGIEGNLLCDADEITAQKFDSLECPRIWTLSPNNVATYASVRQLSGKPLAEALSRLARR